ncbi:MAG: exodeoxyribonuclease VII large subunit [Opitutales bacterium]
MPDDFLTPSPDQILKVTALTRLIKGQLEENFARVWVQGEVSNLRKQSSGHVYFSLKDDGSQLPCALFARDAARQSFELRNGMEVLLLGDISVFEPHGRYQLITRVAIQSGEGRLQLEYERLKRKLAGEGLFDAENKQSLPVIPKKIAVITSPTGAAVQDFLRILKRREYAGEVIIFPARVQGQGSAEEVESMLKYVSSSQGFDLVVLTRGGGSIEDLWTFNEESVARAVTACPVPVISAIGHEIDHVLTDYAADRRAETPSGAAELISSLYLEAVSSFIHAEQDFKAWMNRYLDDKCRQIRDLQARMHVIAPQRSVQYLGMRIDDLENRLKSHLSGRLFVAQKQVGQLAQRVAERHPRTRIRFAYDSLEDTTRRLERASARAGRDKQDLLDQLQHRLSNGSLQASLKRGFAVIQSQDGHIIDSAGKAGKESLLSARFHDGEIELQPKE